MNTTLRFPWEHQQSLMKPWTLKVSHANYKADGIGLGFGDKHPFIVTFSDLCIPIELECFIHFKIFIMPFILKTVWGQSYYFHFIDGKTKAKPHKQ